jgi:hypothetical protein
VEESVLKNPRFVFLHFGEAGMLSLRSVILLDERDFSGRFHEVMLLQRALK